MIFLQSLAFYLRRGQPLALGFCPSPLIHVDTSDLNLQFITFNHENLTNRLCGLNMNHFS